MPELVNWFLPGLLVGLLIGAGVAFIVGREDATYGETMRSVGFTRGYAEGYEDGKKAGAFWKRRP